MESAISSRLPVIISANTPPSARKQRASTRPQVALIMYSPVVTSVSRSFALSRSGLGGVLILVCHYSGLSGGGSRIILKMDALGFQPCATPPPYLNGVRLPPWLTPARRP